MADDLLLVYSSPGPVDPAEFSDWFDNEHVPAFRALDGLEPEWLVTCEIETEKRIITSVPAADPRVYSLLSDSWADGHSPASGPAPVVLAVSMSVPPSVEPDLAAYYEQEHYPLLLAVPGWRRARRYVLASGSGPKYLSLHEIDSQAAFDEPGYKEATSTPWRNRIVAAAISREKRVFGLHEPSS